MKEELAKKLNEIFAKVVDEIVGVLTEEEDPTPAEESNPEENTTNEEPTENEVPQEGGAPEETETPPAEEPPAEVPPAEEVPPTDGSIEQALNELAAQEGAENPLAEVPPVDEQTLPPAYNPEDIAKLQSDLSEANKTIESLIARIGSLEEALKNAGVIVGSNKVGDETPRITPSAAQEGEDAFENVIAAINGK